MATGPAELRQVENTFTTQMESFSARLNEACGGQAELRSLRDDFHSFQQSIMQTLRQLHLKWEQLEQRVDVLETHSRRKMLLLHGVAESAGEDPVASVAQLCADKLGLNSIMAGSIVFCRRLGKVERDAGRKRPILVKFQRLGDRAAVWNAKTKLKGTGVSLSEFLTAGRRKLFIEARKAFGMSKAWTRDGCVYVSAESGSVLRVSSEAQLHQLMETAVAAPATQSGADIAAVDGAKQRPTRSRGQSKITKVK